jgi:hypothetical protein
MLANRLKTDQRIIRFCLAIILLIIILISVYFDPVNYKITDCSFKNLMGISCPGCGLTRSFNAGANLNVTDAFAYHLLGPFLLLGFVLISATYLYESISGNTMRFQLKNYVVKTILWTVGITWAGFWITRVMLELFYL